MSPDDEKAIYAEYQVSLNKKEKENLLIINEYRNWKKVLQHIVNLIMNLNMQFIIDMLIYLLEDLVCNSYF